MSRMRETFDIAFRLLTRLSAPNHSYRSWSQVARREHLSDEQATRAMARCEEMVGGGLTESRNNRLVPTEPLGREFRNALERILFLGQDELVEVLSIATTPGLVPAIIARVIIEVSKDWGQLVRFKLSTFSNGIREAVESGQADLGITGDGDEAAVADEKLQPPLQMVALVTDGHRLSHAASIDADHFSPEDRVFYSDTLEPLLGDLLARVPALNRTVVSCPVTLHALIAEGAGIGFEYASSTRQPGEAFNRVPVTGVEPLTLGLVLPKKRDRLSEPAQCFLEVLMRAFKEGLLPAIPSLDIPDPELPLPEPVPA